MSSISSIRFGGTFRNVPMFNFREGQDIPKTAFEKLAADLQKKYASGCDIYLTFEDIHKAPHKIIF